MKNSIIGFPRVGKERELKFSTEKYFRNEINEAKLEETALDIRKKQWKLMSGYGIDFIPSNDFSYYDTFLDAAYMFNIIPDRYKKLNLSEKDTYFAMARGYQGKNGDVKALSMKKWFNTNYHYIVPEIDDNTDITLKDNKPLREYKEALELGVITKPVIVGPYTLLKLSRYVGKSEQKDYVNDITAGYIQLIYELELVGCEWIQFDEPGIVCDVSVEDTAFFKEIYGRILNRKGNVKILLQTYFGDIRDIYSEVISLDFDGIGLDFYEGKETYNLIKKYGFPKEKILFAGVVNGKNIWKNDYLKTLTLLGEIKKYTSDIVISTSCSLLHVPYTLEGESRLPEDIKKHFSFACEKIKELDELKKLADSDNYSECSEFTENRNIILEDRKATDKEVTKRVNSTSDADYVRIPEFAEREKIQKKEFSLPVLPATTIGSFPQTADLKKKRKEYRNGNVPEAEYEDFIKGKIKECIELQEKIGLDVLVHGEYERNDMVEYFGENLDGYIFTEKAWVQSYGTRCVKPPVIWGDIKRRKPMTVKWSVYAQSLTKKPVKGMLTGPVTILNWSFPREDISLKECAYQIAYAIRDEVLDLEKNGIKIIQVDEAALREKLPLRKCDWHADYLDWAIKAFRIVHSKVKPETQIHTHMCYSEFDDIIADIDDMDADVITFEASRSDLTILEKLRKSNFRTEVGPGVYDIHSPRVPSIQEIIDALIKMMQNVDTDKLWVNPDCGLKTRGEKETVESLSNMVEAARIVRNKI